MRGTCFLDVVGTFHDHLPCTCCEGSQVLIRSIRAYEYIRGRWRHIKLPRVFTFLDLDSHKAFSIDRYTGHVQPICHSKILVDSNNNCFYRFMQCTHRWESVICIDQSIIDLIDRS